MNERPTVLPLEQDRSTSADPAAPESAARPMGLLRARDGIVLANILGIAAFIRFLRLGQLPDGIHVDEAFNILDAQKVLNGWRPVFLPDNAGRDVIYTYFQAALFSVFGSDVLVARSASALIGVLSIAVFWFASNELLRLDGRLQLESRRRIALLTAGLSAFSLWHLHFSRFGIRAILFPIFVCLVSIFWMKLLDELSPTSENSPWAETLEMDLASKAQAPSSWKNRHLWFLGLSLGMAFYAHPAGRALLALPLVHWIWLSLHARISSSSKQSSTPTAARFDAIPTLKSLGGSAVIATLVALPLFSFWIRHPQTFTGHASETSILDEGLGALLGNIGKVAGMFFWRGDPAPWRNYASRSVFGPLDAALPVQSMLTAFLAILFLVGLAIIIRGTLAGRRVHSLLFIWLVILSAPSVLTDAAPNFSRALGLLPLPFFFAALGFERLTNRNSIDSRPSEKSMDDESISSEVSDSQPAISWRWITAGVLCLAVLAGTSYDYFWRFAKDPEMPLAFDADRTDLGKWVGKLKDMGVLVFMDEDLSKHPTVKLAAGFTPKGFDYSKGFVYRPGTPSTNISLPLPRINRPDIRNQAKCMLSVKTEEGRDDLVSVSVDSTLTPPIIMFGTDLVSDDLDTYLERHGEKLSTVFDNQIKLLGRLPNQCPEDLGDGKAPFLLVWEVLAPLDLNLSYTFRIADQSGTLHQNDQLLFPSYPTTDWQPGEIIITRHHIDLPDGLPERPLRLKLGLYELESGRPMTDETGTDIIDIGKLPQHGMP